MDKKKDILKELEKIGIEEIAQKTHIGESYLKMITQKDFEGLLNKNATAYTKIIEREYGLDFSEWMSEFNEFKAQNLPNSTKMVEINLEKNIYKKDSKKAESVVLILLAILLLIGSVFYFKLYKFLDIFADDNKSVEYSKAKIVEEVEDNLVKVGVSVPKFDENNSLVGVTEDNNTALNALDKSILSQDKNISDINITKPSITVEMNATIVPQNLLWLNITELSPRKERGFATSKNIDINLSKEQLISTGHSNFTIKNGEEIMKFDGKDKVRLHIKDGNITQITKEIYEKLKK